MRAWVACGLLLLVPVANAQEVVEPVFEISSPSLGHPISYTEPTELLVSWSYTFPNPPAAAASGIVLGDAVIAWSLTCSERIRLLDPMTTTIVLDPLQTHYEGTTRLALRANQGTPGLVALACDLQGHVGAGQPSLEADDAHAVSLYAEWQSNFTATATHTNRLTGPQKQTTYPIDITNQGNTPMAFRTELADRPNKGWNVLLPEPVVVVPGESATVLVSLATPFHNGYNKGSTDFEVLVLASPVEDPSQTAGPQVIQLGGQVRGWYVPGPSPALLVVALGLGLLMRRESLR